MQLRYSMLCLGAVLFAAMLGWPTLPVVAQAEKPTCYKLIKVDIIGVHPDDANGSIRAQEREWAERHDVRVEPDGTMVITRKDRPTHTWRVNPKTGQAIATETNPASSVEVTWTVPPDYWCSNQDVRMSLTAKATGEIFGKPSFWQRNAERWDMTPGSTVEGTDPFAGLAVGRFSNGYGPSAAGSISLRPKYKGGDEFISLNVGLLSNDSLDVHYHYQRTDDPPPPPHECPHTFERDWVSTTWGRFVIKVSGTTLSGEYSNRDGKFGPGTVAGTVTGNKFEGTWKDAAGEGTISLTLSANGCEWTGSHTVKPGTTSADGPMGKPHPKDPGGGTGGGGVPGGPTGPAGTGGPGGSIIPTPLGPTLDLPIDPCMDPSAQQCIEEWIQLATKLRNKYDTSPPNPNGAWRNNEFGVWVGHQVRSGGKHDNWETVYRSNKYCYIWLEYQKEHESSKYYGTELPSLKSFVEACMLKKKLAEPHGPGGHGGVAGPGGGTGAGSDLPKPPAGGKMTIEAMKRTVAAGETVMVPVHLWNGADVANMNYTLVYNTSVAKTEGDPTSGYLLDDALFTSNPKELGTVKLAFSRSSGISGSGPVAHVPFRAVGKPGDKTPLTLAVTTINNAGGATPPIDVIHGEILITGPGGVIPGDCDGDGVVTSADAWCALQMSVGNMPEKPGIDMDSDAKVTSRDATLILQKRVNR